MRTIVVLLLALTGASAQEAKAPEGGRTAVLRKIYAKDRATAADACGLVLEFAGGTPAGFDAVRKDLEGRGILEADWALQEAAPLTKGQLAYMLCKALGIRGGLIMSVFGLSRRYAFRECVHLNLMAAGNSSDPVSGRELIDALSRAELHRQAGTTDSLRK